MAAWNVAWGRGVRSFACGVMVTGAWAAEPVHAQDEVEDAAHGAAEPGPEMEPAETGAPPVGAVTGETDPGEAVASVPDGHDAPDDVDVEAQELARLSLEELLGIEFRVSVASLFDHRSLESGATVDLVTQQSWFRRGARRTLDAIGHLPGMVVYPTLWGGQALAVRGFASSASVRGIALLLDGVPMTELATATGLYFSSNIELPVLDRIEVVRGPGSAVHGSDAFHGVLSLRSYAPDHDTREAGMEIGSDLFDRRFARMSQGIGERLRVDVVASYSALPDQERGYRYTDPATMTAARSERELGYRSFHGMTQLRYEGDRWDAQVALHANLWRAYEAQGLGRPTNVSALAGVDTSSANSETYIGRAQIGVDLAHDVRAEVSTYFWWMDSRNDTTAAVPSMGTILRPNLISFFDEHRMGTRLTFRQDDNRIHTQWLVGYEFTRGDITSGRQLFVLGDTRLSEQTFPARGFDRNIHSFLLSAQTKLADGVVRLHYGGRIDHYSDFGLQATPRLGVVVVPRDDLAFKVLYGRAFRAPAGLEVRGNGSAIRGSTTLDPEIIDTVELVAQYQRQRVRVNLTGFGSIWNDAIVIVPFADPAMPAYNSSYENVGRSRSLGAEASFVYAREDFRIDASASYVASENTRDGVAYRAFPQLIGNLGLGYTLRSAHLDFYLFQRLQVGMSEGVPNAVHPSQPGLPPYYRVDLHVAWQAVPDHLTFFVNLRNALALDNTMPSLWNAENGAQTMGVNVSFGANGAF